MAPALRTVDAPRPEPFRKLPPLPKYWLRIVEDLYDDPGIGPAAAWVYAHVVRRLKPWERRIELTFERLSELCRYKNVRTIQRHMATLVGGGYLIVHRDRIGARPVIEVTFELRGDLQMMPEAPIVRGSNHDGRRPKKPKNGTPVNRTKMSGTDPVSTPDKGSGVRVGLHRTKMSGASLFEVLDQRELTTTTYPSAIEGDASELLLSSPSPEEYAEGVAVLEAAPEALGSPQDDRREENAQIPDPVRQTPLWAARALQKIAAAWPDVSDATREYWLRDVVGRWLVACDEKGRPPSYGECGRVAALALEYAALKRADDPLGYLAPVLAGWCSGGLNSEGVDLVVAQYRPKAPAVAVEVDRPREKPREASPAMRAKLGELNRAWEAKRHGKPGADEEIARLTGEMEKLEAVEAQTESRLEGVSACPPAGPEIHPVLASQV